MAEIHDGSAVGHILTNIGKFAKRHNIMQGIFSSTIAEVKPELQAMNTEHEHQRKVCVLSWMRGNMEAVYLQYHSIKPALSHAVEKAGFTG